MIFCKKIIKISVFLLSVFAFFPAGAEKIRLELPGIMGGIDFSAEIPWNERVFLEQDSFSYNHDLAAMSCALSQAAYTDVNADTAENFLRRAYLALGFDADTLSFFYDVDYKGVYGFDQSAFSFAARSIGGKNLVAVVIRGTPEGAEEWISNTNVADSVFDKKGKKIAEFPEEHEGFSIAVRQILEALDSYIAARDFSYSDTIFWLTGHSRGAAEANLLSVNLLKKRAVPGKQIFSYTFAAPNVTRSLDYASGEYGFIWNIVNEEDIVPTVPFESGEWAYHKYGNVKAFKNAFTARDLTQFFEEEQPAMSKNYERFFGRRFYAFNSGNYVPYIISEILQAINKAPENFYDSVLALHDPLGKILVKLFTNEASAENTPKQTLLQRIINRKNPTLVSGAKNALNDMHIDVTYLAWLLTLDEKALYDTTNSYILRFKGKAELQIKDETGEILAKIVNGAPEISLDGSNLLLLKGLTGTVYVGVQGNRNITVEITKDSMFPTTARVELEEFSAEGSSRGVILSEKVHPSLLKGYELFLTAGKSNADEVFAENAGRETISKAWQNAASGFSVRPIESFDSSGVFSVGLTAGTNRAFAIGEVGSNLADYGESEITGLGFVLQSPVFGALNAGIMGEWKWVIDTKDKSDRVGQVPYAAFVVSFQPRWHFQIMAAFGADFHLKDFNDTAFKDELRRGNDYIEPVSFSQRLDAYPCVRIILKF